MKRSFIILLLILMNLIIIFYIDYKINLPDLDYYHGKDGGIIVRIQVTIVMSVIYFFIMSKKNKIIYSIYGLIIGILSMFICYLVLANFTKLSDIFYQLIVTIIFISTFHFIEKINKVHK
jgi:hypothetical protein